ncbi:hypothetical protein [Kitasatospora sp. NPDC017646]|uniref:hypothetical protein n=1 Tax=Kitasatospora sp. NPDC017646 TaxID=3364024 RepID=UPI00379C3062
MALTTGTSGTPTAVWFSRAEVESAIALSTISAVLGLGLRPRHTVAYAGCSRATLPLVYAEESTTRAGAGFVQFGTVEPALALDRLAAPLGLPGKDPQVTHLTTSACCCSSSSCWSPPRPTAVRRPGAPPSRACW